MTEFINSLREELSDVDLSFNNDDLWDDITYINDANRQKWIKKCASFQTAQLCATTEPTHKNLKLNLKIGKHKFHRTYRPWEKSSFNALTDINDIYDDDDEANNNDDDEEEWAVDQDVIDVDDDEWNNDALWTSITRIPPFKSQILKRMILRKCRGKRLCLCQYMDKMFDNGQKHQCSRKKRKLLNLMDTFLAGPMEIAKKGKLPINVRLLYHPSIVHLHIMSKFPFFHRRFHLHRYKVPWFKYRRYQHLRPNIKPKWLPRWIWRELEGHLKRPRGLKPKLINNKKPKKIIYKKGKKIIAVEPKKVIPHKNKKIKPKKVKKKISTKPKKVTPKKIIKNTKKKTLIKKKLLCPI